VCEWSGGCVAGLDAAGPPVVASPGDPGEALGAVAEGLGCPAATWAGAAGPDGGGDVGGACPSGSFQGVQAVSHAVELAANSQDATRA
jgi:hypothetical protein